MFRELGGFFGNIIVILYLLTILNFFVKYINKNYRKVLMKNEKIYQAFTKLMKFTIKRHKLFGILTVVFILLHFILQFTQFGLNIPGVIAALIMFVQVGFGIYGSKKKKRGKSWLWAHRIIAVILMIAILIHVS
jgi:hypothetical protein